MRLTTSRAAAALVISITVCAWGAKTHAQASKPDAGYTRQDLIQLLRDEGYGSVKPHAENSVQFKVDGRT